MVAVRPGRMPMVMPSSVAQATLRIEIGVRMLAMPWPR